MINCTVAGNRNGSFYAGLWLDDSQARLTNCIFWDNRSSLHGNEEDQIYLESYEIESTADIDHSIVQGWTGDLGGVGNFDADPMLVDPLGPDGIAGTGDDDLRLSPGSPAINAADPNATGLPTTDLDGHARLLCGRVDMGTYEFGIGDFNCDQSIDLTDFANWSTCMTGPGAPAIPPGCEAFDFNADGDVDLADYVAFVSAMNEP
ncbi:MAG: choice-of-anchor Q domain-containing protein [Phycisphaerales bacterium]|nr:choice-of-anchor Q domain-containing protein [Phycisphaerales bacterium]